MCTTELQRPIYFMCAYILRYCRGTCEEWRTVRLQHFKGGLIIEDMAQTFRASVKLINQLIPLKAKFTECCFGFVLTIIVISLLNIERFVINDFPLKEKSYFSRYNDGSQARESK